MAKLQNSADSEPTATPAESPTEPDGHVAQGKSACFTRRKSLVQIQPCPPLSPIEIAKFWTRVQHGEDFQCWEWQGRKSDKGYGRFRKTRAHRIAYELTKGAIPEGAIIRHRCDNPACCNPKHLLIGHHSDNSQDALERDRFAVGARHGSAKLSPEAVDYIRRNPDGLKQTELAQRFGVAKSTVSYVRSGRQRRQG